MTRRRRPLDRKGMGYELSDDAKDSMTAIALGNPLNMSVYDPPETARFGKDGAWAMITRALPPLERNVDEDLTVGRVFWIEHWADADDFGFRPDGSFKVRCPSPFGEVGLFPYEYTIMKPQFLINAWQEKYLTFHPLGVREAEFNDQVFYIRSRGIDLADAVVMALGSITGPVGWFEPSEETAAYVARFSNIGMLTDENHKRRAAARRQPRAKATAK